MSGARNIEWHHIRKDKTLASFFCSKIWHLKIDRMNQLSEIIRVHSYFNHVFTLVYIVGNGK